MLPLAFGFGAPQDMVIIAVVVLLLFGGSKLAGFGKSLGEGTKEFKKAIRESQDDNNDPPRPSAPLVMETPQETRVRADEGPHTAEATTAGTGSSSVKE